MGHWEDLDLDVMKLLKFYLNGFREVVGWMSLVYDKGPVAGSCKHGNGTSVSVRYQEFLVFVCTD